MLWRHGWTRLPSHIGYQIRLKTVASTSTMSSPLTTHESLSIVSTPSEACLSKSITACNRAHYCRCSSGYWAVFPRHPIGKFALLFRMYPSRPIYHGNRAWGCRSSNRTSFEKPQGSGRGWWFRVGKSGQDDCAPPPPPPQKKTPLFDLLCYRFS